MPPTKTVVAAIRFVIEWKVSILPVKSSGIHNHATNSVTMSTQPFGQGMDNDGCTMLNWLGKVGVEKVLSTIKGIP